MKNSGWFLFTVCLSACTVVYNQPAPQSTTAVAPTPQYRPQRESGKEEDWRPANIAETIAVCKNVQAANNIPVNCNFDYVNGLPMMVIGFPEIESANYVEPMLNYVAAPFCNSANNANRQAFLLFVVNSAFVGNLYSCEKDEATGWFDLEKLYEQ